MQLNPLHARKVLSENRIRPTKRKGQHFVIDPRVVDRHIGYANLRTSDLVFEIGAGLGALTEAIAALGNRLITIEIDSRLVKLLAPSLKEQRNVCLLRADALSFELKRVDKVISNIPYSLSSQLTFRILESEFKTAILTYQIDFARRMIARPGSRDYSRLSVNVYYRANVEILERVPRNAFFPMPNVDSAIVRLERRKPPFAVDDEGFFFRMLREIFPYRNQLLRKVLRRFLKVNGLANLDALDIMRSASVQDERIRNIDPESIARISNTLLRTINEGSTCAERGTPEPC